MFGLFEDGIKRLYRTEKVTCPHCGGTGKCSCGVHILQNVHMKGCESVKAALGVQNLCLGVCDVCKGKGYHIEEFYTDVQVNKNEQSVNKDK